MSLFVDDTSSLNKIKHIFLCNFLFWQHNFIFLTITKNNKNIRHDMLSEKLTIFSSKYLPEKGQMRSMDCFTTLTISPKCLEKNIIRYIWKFK